MRCISNFNQISLDDASILNLIRAESGAVLVLELDFAYLLTEHPQSGGQVLPLEHCQLVFNQVVTEKIRYWDTSQQQWSEWQSDIKKTLRQIMTSKQSLSHFTLDGFTDDSCWFEWCIETDRFILQCGVDHCELFSINGAKNDNI